MAKAKRAGKQKRPLPTTLTPAMREAFRVAGAMGGTKRWAGSTPEERQAELRRVTKIRERNRRRRSAGDQPVK